MPVGGVPQGYGSANRGGGMTCFDKIKMGFGMGFVIGMSTGLLFGMFRHRVFFMVGVNEFLLIF